MEGAQGSGLKVSSSGVRPPTLRIPEGVSRSWELNSRASACEKYLLA